MIKRKLGFSYSEINPLLDQISNNSIQLYDGTRDFIWAIDPHQDSLYELMIRLKDFGDEIFSETNVDFKINGLTDELQSKSLDMDWKRHLALIFKEGMNNTLKHSESNNVLLDSKITGDEFELILEDDGRGFDLNEKKKGNGLKNIKKRAETLNAELDIETKPGKGTRISIKGKFPIKSLNYN
jgi:signal transduction histidine kinase